MPQTWFASNPTASCVKVRPPETARGVLMISAIVLPEPSEPYWPFPPMYRDLRPSRRCRQVNIQKLTVSVAVPYWFLGETSMAVSDPSALYAVPPEVPTGFETLVKSRS